MNTLESARFKEVERIIKIESGDSQKVGQFSWVFRFRDPPEKQSTRSRFRI